MSPIPMDAINLVDSPACGAKSIFIGTTKNSFDGKKVVRLEYEAYTEMAYEQLYNLCLEVRKKFTSLHRIAIFHRTGVVPIGDSSVLIATSAPHRNDAIAATEWLIYELKKTVPIWKKEIYSDGTSLFKENIEFFECTY